jgi:hypothetical protein
MKRSPKRALQRWQIAAVAGAIAISALAGTLVAMLA